MSVGVASFALVTDSQHQHNISRFLDTIQGKITRPASRNHQFTQGIFHRPANQRMMVQNLHRLSDEVNRLQGIRRYILHQEICHTFEIGNCLRRVDYLRQVMVSGLDTFLPRTLVRRYACTSSMA